MVVNPYIIRFRIHIGNPESALLKVLSLVRKTAISIKMHDFNS